MTIYRFDFQISQWPCSLFLAGGQLGAAPGACFHAFGWNSCNSKLKAGSQKLVYIAFGWMKVKMVSIGCFAPHLLSSIVIMGSSLTYQEIQYAYIHKPHTHLYIYLFIIIIYLTWCLLPSYQVYPSKNLAPRRFQAFTFKGQGKVPHWSCSQSCGKGGCWWCGSTLYTWTFLSFFYGVAIFKKCHKEHEDMLDC